MKGHIDQPADRHQLQVKLLSERLAVWLFQVNGPVVDEYKRERIAERMLLQFEIKAKWTEDKSVFTDDRSYADCIKQGADKVFTVAETKTIEQKIPPDADQDDEICTGCNGMTLLCMHCNLPKGRCWERGHKFNPVVCAACGGTGKEV